MSTQTTDRIEQGAEERYLRPTPLLDYDHPQLQTLIEARGWGDLPERERIGAIYDFVRDEIAFGFNATDLMPASSVLADHDGQCDTKATLLMALLRATGIPCRLRGANVDKRLHHGMLPTVLYRLWLADIRHNWVEVFFEGRWIRLDGVILDHTYLDGVRTIVGNHDGEAFLGYAVGTNDLAEPPNEWRGVDTAIQAEAVTRDLGVTDDPDSFYREQGANFTGAKGWFFRHVMRDGMNRKVAEIRALGTQSTA